MGYNLMPQAQHFNDKHWVSYSSVYNGIIDFFEERMYDEEKYYANGVCILY